MKRFISILFIISLCFTSLIAEEDFIEEPDTEVQDENFVYEPNGAGDNALKIGLMGTFPLNFKGQLYPGGAAELGYYRFLNSTIALGGEASIAYNVSIGQKPLITVPITVGAMFQPYYKKFEFPITLGIGMTSMSCQGMSYFPAFTLKSTAGVFYRMTEAWSIGGSASFTWIPQWFKDSSKNFDGLFSTAGIIVRYHF